jgi:hypothetical protein
MPSSRILRSGALVRSDISQERIASIIAVTRNGVLLTSAMARVVNYC